MKQTRQHGSDADRTIETAAGGAALSHAGGAGMQREFNALAADSPRQLAQRKLAELAGGGAAQLAGGMEEEEELPATAQSKRAGDAGIAQLEGEVGASAGGLPGGLKVGVEQLSGMAMDDVNVHYNSSKPAELQALAYAQGNDIHVGPGQEQHLPHEAWHVVQQRQGRVQPTTEAAGVAINDDRGLEAEADTMGARAMQMQTAKKT